MKYQLSAVALVSAVVLTGCGNEPLSGQYQCYQSGSPTTVLGFSNPNKMTFYSTKLVHINVKGTYLLSREHDYGQSGNEIYVINKETGEKRVWQVSKDRNIISNENYQCQKEVIQPNTLETQDGIDRLNNQN